MVEIQGISKQTLVLAEAMNHPIEDLHLTTAAFNALDRWQKYKKGKNTIGAVYLKSINEGLKSIRNIGDKIEAEIEQALTEYFANCLLGINMESEDDGTA